MKEEIRRIADRMRAWRAEAGLTLQELADRSGVSASAIHKIENHRMVNDIPANPWWLDAGELSSCHKIVQILVRNGADARTTNVKKWLRDVYG